MRGEARISPIYRDATPDVPPTDWEQWSRIERLRRRAWLDAGVIAVVAAELPDHIRSEIQAWAEEQYGRR